jgi:acyl transferase domain-containing protein/pimeloyl-ACP methyl ester carboxylesterase/acyl carrier protein
MTEKSTDQNSPLIKNALLELRRMRNKLSVEQREKNEPIAIVGTACRFSGGVDNSEKFYQLLKNGVDTIGEIPTDRWDVEKYFDANPDVQGKMYTRHGSFLSQVDKFDASFFNISGREANTLDPQQRLLLELSWEALENAAIVNADIPQKRAGVFVAGMNVDYAQLVNEAGGLDVHTSSGTMVAVAAGRLAYVLGLHGPTMIVDTACSSSLVAVHIACQSLRRKECDIALAGGANLMLTPHAMIIECSTRMLAPDGRCKTFDADANGFGRGEGGGMVALKRLSDAQANGDNIIALIRGSAVNHDGHSSGLSVPNGLAQESVIREALKNSQLEASDISYIEAHGTGTHLGDPIELGALQGVFGKGRDADKPLLVGSAKTNLGHLEWSAGITGLLKTAVSLQHNKILPHINYSKPNPLVDWDTLDIRIPTSCEPWPAEILARAGVSSFGFSGTNSHVVMEQAPVEESNEIKTRGEELFVISAKTAPALRDQIKQYREFFENNNDLHLENVCFTSAVGRSHFSHRLSVHSNSLNELKNKLAALEAGKSVEGASQNSVNEKKSLKWSFLCTGQGSQYIGMAQNLYRSEPVFQEVLDQCNEYLREQLPLSLLDVMFESHNEEELNKTMYTQPALYALETGLAALWSSWGIKPSMVLGHSVGEYAAAHIAGVFSLQDGLKLIAARAKLMQALPAGGSMAVLMTSADHVHSLIKEHEKEISLAAINGKDNVVISGMTNVVDSICQQLEIEGIKIYPLAVSHAFHSPLMDSMLEDFKTVAQSIDYQMPKLSIVSNISGKLAGKEIADAEYWVKHVRAPVEFAKGMKCLVDEGASHYLELGPKPVLLTMARACIELSADRCFSSLQQGKNDLQAMFLSLGEAYVQGAVIKWQGLYANRNYRRIVLPTYPFQRKRYWVKNEIQSESPDNNFVKAAIKESPLTQCLGQGDTQGLVQYIQKNSLLSNEEKSMLPAISKALMNAHQQDEGKEKIRDWFYSVEWQEKIETLGSSKEPKMGYWLVLSNSDLGDRLAKTITENSQHCIQIKHGQTYESPNNNTGCINPESLDEFDRLLNEAQSQNDLSLLGVIYLWGAEQSLTAEFSLDELNKVQARVSGGLLNLIKSLANQSALPEYGVWVITRGMYSIYEDSDLIDVVHSDLSGLGQSISLEYNDLWGGMIDLSIRDGSHEAENIIQHIIKSPDENRVVYRNKKQYVPRLKKQTYIQKKSLKLDNKATYIVTGATGGLGLNVVNWLASKGANNIIMLARSKPDEEINNCINGLQKKGVSVVLNQVDVTDKAALGAIIEAVKSTHPLRGIVHAAGGLGDGLIQGMSWEKYSEVIAPKVQGGWNLHQLTKNINLDFFVLFSSAASVFGAAGQANYAAANSFLDTLAHFRTQQGLPGVSVNWGPWAKVGMASKLNNKNQKRLASKGIKEIDVKAGLACLENILADDASNFALSQVAVLPIDWTEFGSLVSANKGVSFLSSIPDFVNVQKKMSTGLSDVYQKILNTEKIERANIVLSYLKGLTSNTLKVDVSILEDDTDLMDVGIDSLMIMEMLDCIKRDLQLMIYPREVYGNPRLNALAAYMSEEFAHTHEKTNKGKENTSIEKNQKTFLITEISDPKEGMSDDFKPLKSMVFLLSTPRSGSTLLRAMLAGHPDLFSPPELHLLTFSSMAKRDLSLKGSYLDEGLQRALMDLKGEGVDKVRALIDELVARDAPITEVYELLQELAGSRQVIDKSPTYALDPCLLERAEAMFNESKYIHLIRNPVSSIESFARMRMDKLLSPGANDPYSLGEQVWVQGNQNIDLFVKTLPKERVMQVKFEDLVVNSDVELKRICEFLNIDYDPSVIDPYSGNRMTDGVHEKSLSIGDPNFLEHKTVESKKAEAWKNIQLPNALDKKTIQVANSFDYEISPLMKTMSSIVTDDIDIPMEETFIEARGLKFCVCSWGDKNAPQIILLHGILDQGAAWEQVAVKLAHEGYHVMAPDLRGHGRSSSVGIGGSYGLMDFLADVDIIIEQISNQKFILVGHSMGTILAAMYASIHAENVDALVLVETVLPVATGNGQELEQIKTQLKYLKEPPKHAVLENINTAAKQLQKMTPGLNDELAKRLALRTTESFEQGLRWTWDPLLSTRAGIASGVSMDKAGYLSQLSGITVPSTLLFGESSRFIRPDDLIELKAAMKNSNQYSIEGGHQLHNEAPQQVAFYIMQIGEQIADQVKVKDKPNNIEQVV